MLPSNLLRVFRRTPYILKEKFSTVAQPQEAEQVPQAENNEDLLKNPDYFKVFNLFTVKDLFDARVHYGHKESSLNEHMLPYIYGSRLGHTIFDLDKTAEHLRAALNFTAHVAYRDGIILFLLRGAQNSHIVEQTAQECAEFAYTRYWRSGTFTNSLKHFGTVTRLPDLCIFFNTLNDVLAQHAGVSNATKMAIPTIGIVDSNCSPNLITYPVPGNDDSSSAIQLYCKLFKAAIMRGKQKRKEHLGL